MKDYKTALAFDKEDEQMIKPELTALLERAPYSFFKEETTPDNTYCVYVWDYIAWDDLPEVTALLSKVETMRHALVTISEDGEIWQDTETCDRRGCDEEFYDILGWTADICLWDDACPLEEQYIPLSRGRLIALMRNYLEHERKGIGDDDMFYTALQTCGFSDNEIESLGFGPVIDNAKCREVSKIVRKQHPEILLRDGSFVREHLFAIGYDNLHITKYKPEEYATDEVKIRAESLFDLESEFVAVCDRNNLACVPVFYVDIIDEAKDTPHAEAGDRIRLIRMSSDPYPVPPGTEGTVESIDDAGQLHVAWDNGRGLALIPGADRYELVEEKTYHIRYTETYSDEYEVSAPSFSEAVDKLDEDIRSGAVKGPDLCTDSSYKEV